MIAYFNSRYLPKADIRIEPDDRGFLLGDGVYEVTPCYDGRFLALERHLDRLRSGLEQLRIEGADLAAIEAASQELIRRNGLDTGKAIVYFQVTRGVGPRTHAFPKPPVPPTVYGYAAGVAPKFDPAVGVSAISVPDLRWSRCDIKSISLVANCLANQQAQEAGAFEAILVRDGVALEGTHTGLLAVFDGEVWTGPKTTLALPSITRDLVLELCAELGIAAREAPIRHERLPRADEIILVGTTTEVLSVVRLDGGLVGDGRPGPISARLLAAFRDLVRSLAR
jgi:D-alanine transaminase